MHGHRTGVVHTTDDVDVVTVTGVCRPSCCSPGLLGVDANMGIAILMLVTLTDVVVVAVDVDIVFVFVNDLIPVQCINCVSHGQRIVNEYTPVNRGGGSTTNPGHILLLVLLLVTCGRSLSSPSLTTCLAQ
jgi:hypothetical protein